MILLSLLIGGYSLGTSYPRHQKILPLFVLISGFALIASGHYFTEGFEALMIPLGGFTIAGAHLINWKYSRSCVHK